MFYAANITIMLEHLHTQDIVYRDLKPENLVLTENGYLKLIDFGFAKRLQSEEERTHTRLGTPGYMAPEILMSTRGYHRPVDWWALGVLTFELMFQYLPFGDTLVTTMGRMHKKFEFPPDSPFSSDLSDFVRNLLRYDPAERLHCYNAKSDPWFINNHMDWSALYCQTLTPDYLPARRKYRSFYMKYEEVEAAENRNPPP
jgi:serine/threonine protein kinase